MIALTGREQEVLRVYVSTGATNKALAKRLNLALKTVDHYMNQILKKTNSENRSQLIVKYKDVTHA